MPGQNRPWLHDMTGTTGTPGNIDVTIASVAVITSSLRTAGMLGVASSTSDTSIAGSASTFVSCVTTAATGTPGRIRQFTLAVASCGSALGAWPPSSCVATHVGLGHRAVS